jgi:sugar phosphate isomerase/epimerase
MLSACAGLNKKSSASDGKYPEDKLGWKLGVQAYTFNRFSFFEALEKADSCELKYVEGFPGQDIGGGMTGKLDYHMDAATRNQILALLNKKGIRLYAYGVVRVSRESDWRKLFEFCKAMQIETITAEPAEKDIPLLSGLCDEYKINVAIHNHPKPSHYWNPDIVLSAINGYSSRLGACADIGHWIRSGLDPLECLKKLNGHVLHLHMKDLNEKDRKAHDVHWGTGISDIPGIIQELKTQHFAGMISAEYEYNWENNRPDVAASIIYFRKAIRSL